VAETPTIEGNCSLEQHSTASHKQLRNLLARFGAQFLSPTVFVNHVIAISRIQRIFVALVPHVKAQGHERIERLLHDVPVRVDEVPEHSHCLPSDGLPCSVGWWGREPGEITVNFKGIISGFLFLISSYCNVRPRISKSSVSRPKRYRLLRHS
jgi:hypothetical protein